MGKFSGILICSDFDGTLSSPQGTPAANCEAIKYFRQNGGMFTVISGRSPEHFEKYSDRIGFDGYIGGINGTVIYDVKKREIIEEHTMTRPELLLDFILKNYAAWDNIKDVSVFGKNEFVQLSASDGGFERCLSEAMAKPVYKILIHGKQPFTEEETHWVRHSLREHFGVWRSWSLGIEIQDIGYDKGTAARRISELLGATTLICAGDYENDIPLLGTADIAYAAEKHHPSLTPLAHRIAAPCEVGTIASIIDELDKYK